MYNMAAIDFNMFHTRFMTDFLQNCEGITAEQRVEIASNYKPDEVHDCSASLNPSFNETECDYFTINYTACSKVFIFFVQKLQEFLVANFLHKMVKKL